MNYRINAVIRRAYAYEHKVSGGSCIYINKLSDIHIPTLQSIIKHSMSDMQKKYKTKR